MKAKQINRFLGAQTITHTMARVDPRDKASLAELLKQKGMPVKTGVARDVTPSFLEDKNELSAYWVNESGVYSIILGSTKPAAAPFQRWVTVEVLPSVRRTGSYSQKRLADSSDSEQLAKRPRIEELQLAILPTLQQQVQEIQTQIGEKLETNEQKIEAIQNSLGVSSCSSPGNSFRWRWLLSDGTRSCLAQTWQSVDRSQLLQELLWKESATYA
jgi:prophage antirepressor-like protein